MPSHIRLLLRLHKAYRFGGRACVLGNQDVWASVRQLERYFVQAGCTWHPPAEPAPHTSRLFRGDADLSRLARDFVHARVLFEAMGFEAYVDLDKYDYDRPAILHDLNLPVPESLCSRFGLVLDGGTVEHVFDVPAAFANTAALVQPGGCVIHLASQDMDHGFYALNPCLFHDYYRVNGFTEFRCFLMASDYRDVLEDYERPRPFFEYRYGMPLECLLETARSWLVFFVARKASTVDSPQRPTQGVFAPDEGAGMRQSSSGFRERVPAALQPLLAPLRPLLRRSHRWLRCRAQRRGIQLI